MLNGIQMGSTKIIYVVNFMHVWIKKGLNIHKTFLIWNVKLYIIFLYFVYVCVYGIYVLSRV